jgi:hypothetical protein
MMAVIIFYLKEVFWRIILFAKAEKSQLTPKNLKSNCKLKIISTYKQARQPFALSLSIDNMATALAFRDP